MFDEDFSAYIPSFFLNDSGNIYISHVHLINIAHGNPPPPPPQKNLAFSHINLESSTYYKLKFLDFPHFLTKEISV